MGEIIFDDPRSGDLVPGRVSEVGQLLGSAKRDTESHLSARTPCDKPHNAQLNTVLLEQQQSHKHNIFINRYHGLHIRIGLNELRGYITALQHFKTAQFQNSQFIVDACPRQATIRHPASAWW